MVREESTLKLHLSRDRLVWFADGDRVPIPSGQGAADFLGSLKAARDRPHIRLLGTPQNAALIVTSYQHCVVHGGTVELASPLACNSALEQGVPEIALFRMRQSLVSGSLGGWRKMTAADFTTYSLIEQFQANPTFTDHTRHLLDAHPAWYDLSFIGGIDPAACARLLCLIVDPRWYVDPSHPDRGSRLQAFLGLHPAMQAKVLTGYRRGSQAIRCAAVMAAWRGNVPSTPERQWPEFFLWRVPGALSGDPKGVLRASQKFISYLRHTWLSALYANTRWSGSESLFAPDMLLRQPDEVAAYKRHAAARKLTV